MDDKIELPYPEWQGPIQEVMLELDRKKLAEKVLIAEAKILQRLLELKQSNDGNNERASIIDGLSLLRTIKRDNLDYPDW